MVNTWSNDEMMKLVELWSEDIIQAQLEGSKRNAIVFIARDMEAAAYVKTGEQCNSKVRKLKLEYRKIVDNNNKTGRGRKDWKFLISTSKLKIVVLLTFSFNSTVIIICKFLL